MSDMTEKTTDKTLREAVAQVARALEERGMLREAARGAAEQHIERLFVSRNGSLRVAIGEGGFYHADLSNPLQGLVDELYASAPADVKFAGGTEEDVVDRAISRFAAQRANRGTNPLARSCHE